MIRAEASSAFPANSVVAYKSAPSRNTATDPSEYLGFDAVAR